jgi:ATPase subunit of ABC transporter with duplicated ATPase domains
MISNKDLMKRYAPHALVEDAEASDYILSLLSSDEAVDKTEDDLTELIDQFFAEYGSEGNDENKSHRSGNARNFARALLAQRSAPQPATKSSPPSQFQSPPNRSPQSPIIFEKKSPTFVDRSAEAEAKKEAKAKKRAKRQQRRLRMNKEKIHVQPEDDSTQSHEKKSLKDLEDMDDHGSAWADLQAEGNDQWGGRGHGGRGVRSSANTASNIHLTSVNLQFAGNELLENGTIQITGGHRYGLLGRNGVGKSALLRRLANHSIPGFPRDVRVMLVKQEVEGTAKSVIQTLLDADTEMAALVEEQRLLEEQIESAVGHDDQDNSEALASAVERLGIVAGDLDAMDADSAEDRARELLKGLKFKEAMVGGPTNHLSGGWRMRLALAQALFVPSDLLLLDECSNHLDFYALMWLSDYLSTSGRSMVIVSHDRNFLDEVCTDIMLLEHKKLSYHVGNFSAFQIQQEEKQARQAQILDASEKKRSKALSFIEQQQRGASKKYQDPKKQRQAKMIKEKKLDRIGNYREDGKRYQTHSLKKMSEEYLLTPEKVVVEADEPVARMKLVDPTWSPGMTPGSPLIQADDMSFGYSRDSPFLLNSLTLDVARGSKIALCGRNGEGKSTLMNLFTGKINPECETYHFSGTLWTHPCLRVGHLTQHSVEELDEYASLTVVEYAEQNLLSGSAAMEISSASGGSKNVRQYLGGFGLGGPHAKRLVGTLSGGERMRLCFAKVMASAPHLLVLDEPSNHVDLETCDALSAALGAFQGSVLVISHNQSFLSGFCKELWVVEDGKVEVRHSESFEELFLEYKSEAIAGASSRRNIRMAKAKLAKKASHQGVGRMERSALI